MASGAIKGITVEIGGDTTKLGKAIGDSEKKSRSLQVELRQVEKLLKFDPTNVELLAQKQTILTQNIKETSDKLNTLKEAESQVIAQFEKGEVAEEQVRALQREIINAENALDKMKTELSSTETAMSNLASSTDSAEKHTDEYKESVEEAKKELEDFKGKASDAFDTLKTGATVLGGAVIATGGYALKLSTDFDQAFNTLVTRTGASKDEMDSLNTAMENVYANNFGDSIEDVAESMATVKQNTKLSGDELQNATERALLMRDTFEFDVNESTRSAKMLMDQYGMSADDAYNLIAQGAQNGLDKNGDLLDTINEYGVHFSGLGLSAEDMFNMLVNGAEGGTFSVDKLGDAVKEFGIRVKDGSDGTTEAFKTLGLDVDDTSMKFAKGGEGAKEALSDVTTALFNMDDPLKQNQVGVALFGTMWEDLGADGVKALMDLEGEVSTSKDALEDINNTKYDDIGSALQGLGRTLETDVVKPLGEELKPVVEDAIEYVQANGPQIKEILSNVVDKVGEFVGFVVNHGDAIVSIIAGIGAGFVLWNVVSMITGVVNAIKAFKLANEGATVAQMLLNAVMNANPIGILITVIGAVVVAITTFILTNEDARAKFVEIWNKIKTVCGNVIDAIVNFFTVTIPTAWNNFLAWLPTFIDGVANWFSQLPGKIWTWLSDIISKISTWGSNIWTTASTYVSNLVSSVVNWFSQLPGRIWTWLVNTITRVATWASNMATKAREAGSKFLNNIITFILQLPGKIWTWLSNAFNRVTTWASNMANKARETGSNFINRVIQFITQLPGKVWTLLSNVLSRVATWAGNMVSRAGTMASNFVSKVVSFIQTLPSRIWTWLQNAVSKVVTWGVNLVAKGRQGAQNLLNAVVNKVREIPGKLVSIGTNIVQGLWNGMSNATQWIKDKISGFVGDVTGWLKSKFGINSPSTVMRDEVGRFLSEGIGVGISENADKPIDAIEDVGDDMLNAIDENVNGATINRKLATTFRVDSANTANNNAMLLSKLDGIYERLSRLQIVLDTGTLVGEAIDKIDAGLANKQLLSARGV